MSLISWNCQGAGKSLDSNKMNYLARLMHSTNAKVTFISETKTSKFNRAQLSNHFNITHSFVVPSEGRSGGLWLLWDNDIDLKITRATSNLILSSLVITSTKEAFCLICMYGDPSHSKTKELWDQIFAFVNENSGMPVLCMGDLNELMYPHDKSNVNYVNYARMQLFCSLVKKCGLFDLGYNGPAYTWCNKRYSSKPLYERLDRFLANAEWCNLYPNANIYNLPILQGDHAPILAILHSKYKKPTYHFKFENWWLLEDDFQETAMKAWKVTQS
jgi:exonuclease III